MVTHDYNSYLCKKKYKIYKLPIFMRKYKKYHSLYPKKQQFYISWVILSQCKNPIFINSRLELTVRCDNTSAIALYQKQGFTIEGTKYRSLLVEGEYVDEYYMGLLL